MTLRRPMLAALAALGLALGAACSGDGADARDVGEGSGSPRGSASGSAAATGTITTGDHGGHAPASDVAALAGLSRDVVAITALLGADALDAGAVEAVYAEGGHAVGGDGSVRNLRTFAVAKRDEPIWNDYAAFYGDPAWLDTFVSQALAGTGPFEGASDDVRRQAIQKGIQGGVMVASVLHELVAAEQRVAAGETDPADGAPHDVDEAWAFYHGDEPAGAPFRIAEGRGAAFGTGDAVNRAVMAQLAAARAAAGAGDAAALKAADDEIVRQILITYIQAAIEGASEAEAALADGDEAVAAVEQAGGLALYRVIAPLVARVDEPAARAALDALDVAAGPSEGMAARVRAALERALPALGIRRAEIGTSERRAGRDPPA